MACNEHNLELDFSGCYICSNCNRAWKPVQPEEYDEFVKSTIDYGEDEYGEDREEVQVRELQMQEGTEEGT